ncbi:hypothetical protein [Exiguobacterium sp.]|uniref:hypothetical protein n=1 Tax=Exiguobacterium sp. TaxID=44751 RepID=UPI00289AE5B1|nr:hypothetical protein [Exiguobacterium sp.]
MNEQVRYEAYTAIVTVGISFFQKQNQFGDVGQTADSIRQTVRQSTSLDEERISAEISIVSGWRKQHRLAKQVDILLLYSDTFVGSLAAIGVEECITRLYGYRVTRKKIDGLDMSTPEKAIRGMQQYLVDLAEILAAHDAMTTLFAPIGGYKSVFSLAYPVASLYGFESWYRFEQSGAPVSLPRLPIRFDEAVLQQPETVRMLRSLYRFAGFSLREPFELSALPDVLGEWVEKHPVYFYQYEGLIGFSPLLILHIEQMPSLYAPRVFIPKKIEHEQRTMSGILNDFKTYQGTHRQQATGFTNRMFRHELDWSDRSFQGSPFSLYRMNGAPQHRAIYRWFEHEGEEVLIFKNVWFNYTVYERERKQLERLMQEDTIEWHQLVEVPLW